MNKSDLKQLIKEEITNILNENEGYSYPYFELRVEDYSELSTVVSIYDEMKDSFQDKNEQSKAGSIFLFQNEEEFNSFYTTLIDNGVPERALADMENN
jgi:hypothetical protein|tara:strand:+ start:4628 stop:4921 length:294 start_codon:yes stop_codon:yes gene_type:complete